MQLVNQQTKKHVIDILMKTVEELEGVNITDETLLISSGYIDSFDIITVIGVIEDDFQIDIDLEKVKLEEFNTIDSICELIYASQKEGA